MNKTTQEIMDSINILIKFYNNMPQLFKDFPESVQDLALLDEYISYEIKKTLKDIIHIERL
jgi:hypothetical protein